MRPSRIVLWSAITVIGGSLLVDKLKLRVPGFSR